MDIFKAVISLTKEFKEWSKRETNWLSIWKWKLWKQTPHSKRYSLAWVATAEGTRRWYHLVCKWTPRAAIGTWLFLLAERGCVVADRWQGNVPYDNKMYKLFVKSKNNQSAD